MATKFEVSWEAPEFEYREKDVSWYWVSIIIAAALIAFAVWQKDFLFGFFVVVAEMLFIVWGNRMPRVIEFRMTDEALTIDAHKVYAMKEFDSWSMNPIGEGWREVIFHFRSRVHPPLIFIIPDEAFDVAGPNLRTVLKEVEYDPSFIDSIEKLLHF